VLLRVMCIYVYLCVYIYFICISIYIYIDICLYIYVYTCYVLIHPPIPYILRSHAVKDFVNCVLKSFYFIRGLTQGPPLVTTSKMWFFKFKKQTLRIFLKNILLRKQLKDMTLMYNI
jgi:hypothetical protein